MIYKVNFDTSAFKPGEERPISIEGTKPVRILVHCFTFRPPPPDYKPCDACGVLMLGTGDVRTVSADTKTFMRYGGELHLDIEDEDGDKREIRVAVTPLLSQSGSSSSGSSSSGSTPDMLSGAV